MDMDAGIEHAIAKPMPMRKQKSGWFKSDTQAAAMRTYGRVRETCHDVPFCIISAGAIEKNGEHARETQSHPAAFKHWSSSMIRP